jgi:hypothetical protein
VTDTRGPAAADSGRCGYAAAAVRALRALWPPARQTARGRDRSDPDAALGEGRDGGVTASALRALWPQGRPRRPVPGSRGLGGVAAAFAACAVFGLVPVQVLLTAGGAAAVSACPSSSPSVPATPTPTASATGAPCGNPTGTPTATPTASPSATPDPAPSPSATVTPSPAGSPSPSPTPARKPHKAATAVAQVTVPSLTISGFTYQGLQTVSTSTGTATVMVFTITGATWTSLGLCIGSPAVVMTSGAGAASGDITMRAVTFSATAGGTAVSYTVSSPPTAPLLPTGSGTLTSVSVSALSLTIPGATLANAAMSHGTC